MEIKYEAVFGPQHLFKSTNAEVIVVGPRGDKTESNIGLMAGNTPDGYVIVAMRRIIKTPVWTVADLQAGRLPEVGCRVDFCHKLNTNWRTGEIKYIDNQVVVIKADDIDRPFVYEFDRVEFKTIETPEEKAQRLRDEWVEIAIGKTPAYEIASHGYSTQLRMDVSAIYDALLSGELPMPKKEDE